MQMYKYVCTMAPSLQQSTFLKGLFKQSQGTIRVNLIKPANPRHILLQYQNK